MGSQGDGKIQSRLPRPPGKSPAYEKNCMPTIPLPPPEYGRPAKILAGIEVAHMIHKGQLTAGLCPFSQLAELTA